MENTRLLILPFAGLFIGWITNYLAIKMLFHPRKPVNLGLFTLQGVFPKRQNALGEKLGKVVATELISTEEILEKVTEQTKGDEIRQIMEAKIEAGLGKLLAGIPMASMFVDESLINKAKSLIFEEFGDGLEEWVGTLQSKLKEKLDIREIVQEKVSRFSSDKLEEVLFEILRKEFKFIELAGAVLGFLIGCVQIAILTVGT
jgi:uncharacterized membrane protein YheB (UPF0754 family)